MACVALLAAQVEYTASAQTPPTRVKAKLVAVDGGTITLQPLSDDPNAKPVDPRRVILTPETRFVQSAPASFSAIKAGDYVGAVVAQVRDGGLRASDIYLYAEPLRGSGEGRFTDHDRLLINGAVTNVQPAGGGGTLTLHYRGAALDSNGKDKAICMGRAVPAPYASALACEGDAVVQTPAGTAVSALTIGDRTLLVPGAIVTATLARVGDRETAPGLIVEKAAGSEKPQSSH